MEEKEIDLKFKDWKTEQDLYYNGGVIYCRIKPELPKYLDGKYLHIGLAITEELYLSNFPKKNGSLYELCRCRK